MASVNITQIHYGGKCIMAKNRYIGEYPVIGIRPTIDGRRCAEGKGVSGRADNEHGEIRCEII